MAAEQSNYSISSEALDKLIQAHDGDSALLFLYLLQGASSDTDSAALALCRTGSEISSAFEKLTRMGIIPNSPSAGEKPSKAKTPELSGTPRPANVMPEYTVEDITGRTRSDSVWTAVRAEAEQITGHILSSNDIRILYGAYDYLELNGEVLILLLHFLSEVYEEKYSGRKRPGAKAIETEAFRWHDAGVDSYEAAEAYITARKERAAQAGRIRDLLQIRGRDLTPTETKYIDGWIAMKMDEEAIGLAYDRTMVNKGQLAWPYMNKILQNWNEKGLHTAEDIRRVEDAVRPESKARRGAVPSETGVRAQSEQELEHLINSI